MVSARTCREDPLGDRRMADIVCLPFQSSAGYNQSSNAVVKEPNI